MPGQKQDDFQARRFRGVVEFIARNMIGTEPPALGDMHDHFEDRPVPASLFNPSGLRKTYLDEGAAQGKLAGLIQSVREANKLPPNWDPRDVNLPVEQPISQIAQELMRRVNRRGRQ